MHLKSGQIVTFSVILKINKQFDYVSNSIGLCHPRKGVYSIGRPYKEYISLIRTWPTFKFIHPPTIYIRYMCINYGFYTNTQQIWVNQGFQLRQLVYRVTDVPDCYSILKYSV